MHRVTRRLAGLGLLCLAVLAGGTARAETLAEALVSAYGTNPTLAAARASLRVTDEDLAEALSAFRPAVSVNATGGFGGDRLQQGRATWTNPVTGALQIVQPLFPLSGYAALDVAGARIEAGRAGLAATEQQVFLGVVAAYLDVLRDEDILRVTAEIATSLARELESNRKRLAEGDVSQTDIALTQTRLAQVQADHVLAEQNLRRSRTAYEQVVGHPPIGLVSPGLPPDLPASEATAAALAMGGNPALLQAKRAEDAARADVGRAEAGLYPSLNVVGSTDYSQNDTIEGRQEEQYTLQLQLRVPLYEGGATQSRIRRAKEFWSQRRAETLIAEREVVKAVADSYDALGMTRDIVIYARDGVTAAENALSGIKQEALLGYRTTLDVLQTEQNLLDARRRLTTAIRNELFAGWQLLAAIGALNVEGVALPVASYTGVPHAKAVEGAWFETAPLVTDEEPVPVPTSTARPAPAAVSAAPAAPAPSPAPAAAEPDFWDELFAPPVEEPQPEATPPTVPAPVPASDSGQSFWTDVLGVPAEEIQY